MRLLYSCILIFVGFTAFAQGEWGVQQCIDYALKHNLSLKQAEINAEINKNNANQSKATVLPSFNAGAMHTYNYGRTIDRFTNTFANAQVLSQNFYISSNVVLWSGLAQYHIIKANEYNYLSSKENIKQQENNLSLNVATAYINVIYCDELLKIGKSQFDITKEQLERTQKMAEAGSIAKSAVYDVKAQLANEELNVTNCDNNYQLAVLTLMQLMNIENISNFNVIKPDIDLQSGNLLETSVQNIYETALKNQPSIKMAEYNLLMSEKNLAAAKGRVSPTISLNGSIGTGYSGLAQDITGINFNGYQLSGLTNKGDSVYTPRTEIITKTTPFADQFKNNINKSFGLTLSLPLFNGLQTYTGVKNAKLNALNAKYGEDLAKQNLYKTIAQSYADAKAALNKYAASKTALEATQESFNYAQQKFSVGAISAFEFNSAKTRLSTSQSNLMQAKYDFLFKLKVLDFYQGKPLGF